MQPVSFMGWEVGASDSLKIAIGNNNNDERADKAVFVLSLFSNFVT